MGVFEIKNAGVRRIGMLLVEGERDEASLEALDLVPVRCSPR